MLPLKLVETKVESCAPFVQAVMKQPKPACCDGDDDDDDEVAEI